MNIWLASTENGDLATHFEIQLKNPPMKTTGVLNLLSTQKRRLSFGLEESSSSFSLSSVLKHSFHSLLLGELVLPQLMNPSVSSNSLFSHLQKVSSERKQEEKKKSTTQRWLRGLIIAWKTTPFHSIFKSNFHNYLLIETLTCNREKSFPY